MSSIPGSVGYIPFLIIIISYLMFTEPKITWVPSGFSGYIWLDTKIVLKKNCRLWKHLFKNNLEGFKN